MIKEPEILYLKELSCNVSPGQELFQVHNRTIWHYKVIGYPFKNTVGWFLPVKWLLEDGKSYDTTISLQDAGIIKNDYNDHKTYNYAVQALADAIQRGYEKYKPKDPLQEFAILLCGLPYKG